MRGTGKRRGPTTPHFLSAKAFALHFAKPLEQYRDKVGSLIFEFGTFAKKGFADADSFVDRLDQFLDELPGGFPYSVEIRNADYLTPRYFETLHAYNVAHVFNAWTRMPDLLTQSAKEGAFTADHVVVRGLLAKGRSYEAAVKAFSPYDRLHEVNEAGRQGLAFIARESRRQGKTAFLYLNNRFEGHAPTTIENVVGML